MSRAGVVRAGDGRRPWWVLSVCVILSLTTPLAAQPRDSTRRNNREIELAISKGLQWLATRQHASGSFGSREDYAQNVGVTALCGLAFLASGSTPGKGPYGEHVSRVTDYVLSCSNAEGFLNEPGSKTHGPMYGHGFATMYLAEVYGMEEREEVRNALKRAVDLIVVTQNDQGGWRYFPVAEEADISVTVCEVMALRAARNAGIAVPKETIDRAVEYIRRCQNPDGGFRYRLLDAAESRLPRSAAAVVALYSAGLHDDVTIERGLSYLFGRDDTPRARRETEYYFYGQYYAVQAAWHAGGPTWENWYPAARRELLAMQATVGAWSDTWIGGEYATAMALIVLQMPKNYLPIFQR